MERAVALGFVTLAFATMCLGPCLPTEFTMLEVRRSFRTVVHPDASVVLAEAEERGHFEGNGRYCQYFVGQLRETELPPVTVLAAYRSSAEVEIVDESIDGLYVSYGPRGELIRKGLERLSETRRTLYVVSKFHEEDRGFDIRCR